MLEIRKMCAKFERPSHMLPRIIFFIWPVTKQSNSGGFKPPQNANVKNND